MKPLHTRYEPGMNHTRYEPGVPGIDLHTSYEPNNKDITLHPTLSCTSTFFGRTLVWRRNTRAVKDHAAEEEQHYNGMMAKGLLLILLSQNVISWACLTVKHPENLNS